MGAPRADGDFKGRQPHRYDRFGSGPAVILVGGALGYRKFKKMEELAQLLAERCTVINYDRRGRGDSTEVKPFALEREIEDIVAAGDLSAAVKHFMGNSIGIPAPFVALMRLMPMWKGLKATAHTLPYDWAALGKHTMYGAPLNADEWPSVTVPTLVVHGAKSPALLQQGSRALAGVLPNAEQRQLEGVSHNVKMNVLAPVLAEFFTRERDVDVPGKVRHATA
jgi:pimeloyl-ACP methyl ester carboxylesterase